MSDLVKEMFYPYPVEQVWAALTEGEAVAQWLMPNNIESPPRVGSKFEFRVDPLPLIGGTVECEILEAVPSRRLVWSWTGVRANGAKRPPQRIEWELTPQDGGTLLRLRQSDISQLPWIMRTMMSMGWGTMIKRWLPAVASQFKSTDTGWTYARMERAPNRGHHKTRTIPASFYR